MSEPINDGGPAFPHDRVYVDSCNDLFNQEMRFPGMALRDYFAAKAMQAGLAPDQSGGEWRSMKEMATWAYATADAMLSERNNSK